MSKIHLKITQQGTSQSVYFLHFLFWAWLFMLLQSINKIAFLIFFYYNIPVEVWIVELYRSK